MDFITESRLHNIIRESVNKLLLSESQESKSISAAKEEVMRRLGYNEQQADKFVRIDLRKDITSLRTKQGGKFIWGVARMYCDGQLDDDNTKSRLDATLKYVSSEAHINEYDRNLNGMSAQDLINRFASNIEMDLENDRNKNRSLQFDGASDYEIVRIDSFEEATEYGDYTDWCVTHYEEAFEDYVRGGLNQFYFCLRNGFENIEPIKGEGCPLDEYGLSMISVLVNENGSLVHCTSRWNHSNGGDDNVMNTEQISNVIKMYFYDVFKPNTVWQDTLDSITQRIANGEDPKPLFHGCQNQGNGFFWVVLCGKENFINQSGQFITELPTADELIKGKWFDFCDDFIDGISRVKMNGKYNFINQNGELLYKKPISQWFSSSDMFIGGFSRVLLNGQMNLIGRDGELLSDQWFDWCDNFNIYGYARVKLNRRYNLIDQNGEFLWKKTVDQWFERVDEFENGVSMVVVNSKVNFIDQNGELLWKKPIDQWFDRGQDFNRYGYARVEVSGKSYYLYKDGNLTEEPPTIPESYIRGVIRESVMDFIKNDR